MSILSMVLLCSLSAVAAPLHAGARTPWTIPAGHGAVGVFRPVSVGIGPRTQLSTTGLLSLVAPRVEVKHHLWSSEDDTWGVAAEAAAGVPTMGLRLLRGYIFPSDAHIPWAAVLEAGPVVGWRSGDWDASLGLRGRLAVPGGVFEPRDLFWFDPMVAPLSEGPTLATRLTLDWHPGTDWVLTGEGAAQVGGGGPDLWGRLFALRALGPAWAVGLGAGLTAETRMDGFRFQGAPLADLQFRW